MITRDWRNGQRNRLGECVRVMLGGALLWSLSACNTAGVNDNRSLEASVVEKSKVRLVMINRNSADEYLMRSYPLSNHAVQEAELATACSELDILPQAEFVDTLVGFLLKPAVKFLVSWADSALEDQLDEYAQSFKASQTVTDFYRVGGSNGPQLNYDCLRLTRLADDGKTVAMDFVARLSIEGGESLKVTPLRLYYAEPQAKSKQGSPVGVAISLQATASIRDQNIGRTIDPAFPSLTIATAKVDTDGLPLYQLEFNPSAKYTNLVPWSAYNDQQYGGALVNLRLDVAEVGNAPKWLELLHELVSDNKDDIVSKLTEAAEAALAEDETAGGEGGDEAPVEA